MLLAIFVTLATFLLEICTTSPVYNMQPAFITTNIGTNGRNIRNLPCISRKNNQSGVCMFAIDCLKANGTHLGTCIDRFYFGSCCHIKPVHHDITDNTIDTDIIPAREPPNRIAATTAKPATVSTTTSPSGTTTIRTSLSTTTSENVVTSQKISTKNTTTIKTTSRPIINDDTTTVGYKLTTFQSVDGSVTTVETTTPKTHQTTLKVKSTTQKPTSKAPTKVTSRPKPTKISSKPAKPSKTTTKPTRATATTVKRTRPTQSTTKKPSTTTIPTKKVTKPNTTTIKVTTTKRTTARPAIVTTKKPVVATSTLPIISEAKPIVTSTENAVTKNVSQVLSSVNGNPATNEIVSSASTSTTMSTTPNSTVTPSPTTLASVVTWTVSDDVKNTTSTTSSSTVNSTTSSGDWVPVTSPDGWVLLPSVPPTTITNRPQDISSAVPTTTTAGTTEVEAVATKPSITYIPLDVTTSSPLYNATTTLINTSSTSSPSSMDTASSTTSTSVNTTPLPQQTTTLSALDMKPVNMSDFTNVCGRRMFPEARIVGGEKAGFGKWPWQISLRQWRTSTYLHKCGAALLNENWAITAAHCVDNVPPSDLLLRLGEHDLSTESEPYLHQERRVQIVASHPQFDPRTFEYDLALLRFYEPVTFQPNILPICIPQTDENFVGRTAHVTGWGRLYEDGPLPSILQEVSVPVINNSVCESMYRSAGYIEHIPQIFICAGWRRGGFDSCEGDSGGPMVIQREDKRFLLAGVISWGIGCAEPNQPGVYTRISEFKDWINQILQF